MSSLAQLLHVLLARERALVDAETEDSGDGIKIDEIVHMCRHSLRNWIGAATLALLTLLGAEQACIGAPLEAYGRLPTLETVALSPDGMHLAYVTSTHEKRAVVVFDIAQKKVVKALTVGQRKLRGLAWADPQHLLITNSQTTNISGLMGPRGEYYMTMVFDIATGSARNVIDGIPRSLNVVAGLPEPRMVDGRSVVFVPGIYYPDRSARQVLFATDIQRGKSKIVEGQYSNAVDWVIDRHGNVVAEADYDPATMRWSLRLKTAGRWKEVFSQTAPITSPVIEGLSAEGKALILRESDDDGAKWRALNLDTGAWDDELVSQYRLSTVLKDPSTRLIIGGERDSANTHYMFFDPKDEAAWEKITLSLDGENVELVSWSDDRNRIVIRVTGEHSGDVYRLVDLRERQSMLVGNAYEDITAADVAAVKTILYAAADGLKIPAYLTLPKNREAKNLPLIVLVHGGPASRDRPGFDWWSQALASRGYAVLQPEFRGSSGFTTGFLAAGYGQWGRKMQSDVSDGVRHLAKQGTIDPARVCIIGGSYGGYAALAGVSLEKGIYRCAVSVAGVSDPRAMLKWTQEWTWNSYNRALRYWDRFMGVEGPKDKRLDEISPFAHAADVSVPILLIHGRDDTVVPIAQSQEMAKALEREHKAVKFVTLQSEDHWLSNSETRLQMLREAITFLEANNPPNG